LIEKVVEIICSCFRKLKGEKDFPDVSVQLQVIKVKINETTTSNLNEHPAGITSSCGFS